MLPGLTMQDGPNGRSVDAVLPTEPSKTTYARAILRTNLPHLIIGQLGGIAVLTTDEQFGTSSGIVRIASLEALRMLHGSIAFSSRSASFAHHVRFVLGIRCEEEMGRVAARRVVAAMTDVETGRVFSCCKNVSDAGGAIIFPADPEDAVPIESEGRPRPALRIIQLLDLIPEPRNVPLRQIRDPAVAVPIHGGGVLKQDPGAAARRRLPIRLRERPQGLTRRELPFSLPARHSVSDRTLEVQAA